MRRLCWQSWGEHRCAQASAPKSFQKLCSRKCTHCAKHLQSKASSKSRCTFTWTRQKPATWKSAKACQGGAQNELQQRDDERAATRQPDFVCTVQVARLLQQLGASATRARCSYFVQFKAHCSLGLTFQQRGRCSSQFSSSWWRTWVSFWRWSLQSSSFVQAQAPLWLQWSACG